MRIHRCPHWHLHKVVLAFFVMIGIVTFVYSIPNPAPLPFAQAQYGYDFEAGTTDWQLDPAVWSRVPSPEGGHALRGTGHGFANLVAHTGAVTVFQFRFRLEGIQSRMHANVLESFAAGHTRYIVALGSDGVWISRQLGSAFQELAHGFVPIAPNMFHEARILVGDGSIDVFIDGDGAVGVDDPSPPPPGRVSFESFDNSPAHVDDVLVQIGPEPFVHPQAPRSPLSLPLGPNVGPFVRGFHGGDIVLSGNDVLTLSQGRYTLRKGNIKMSGNSRLRILPGAALIFDRDDSPLFHWGIDLMNSSVLDVDGGTIVPGPGNPLIRIGVFGTSQVIVRGARPWIHFINAGGQASVTIVDSRFVTGIGGSIQLADRVSVRIFDSQVGAIALFIPPGSRFTAGGIRTGFFPDFDLQRDWGVFNIDYNLEMHNTEIAADTLGDGPYERGWVVFADETARTRIMESTLRKLVLQFRGNGPPVEASGVHLNRPTTLHIGDVELFDVTVTGQWGFFLYGSRGGILDDCHGTWIWLEDQAELLMRNSDMNELDTRRYKGVLSFENAEWVVGGEIIEANDFTMAGTIKMDPAMRNGLSWSQSAVQRRFPVLVLNQAGSPLPGVQVQCSRGSQVITAVTDPTGRATIELRFIDQDYKQPCQLTTNAGHSPVSVDFFTDTPIVLRP